MRAYNIDFALSATLTAKVVEEMVRKVVEEQTGKKVDTVKFKIDQEYPDRPGSLYRATFEGCTVTFDVSKPNLELPGQRD